MEGVLHIHDVEPVPSDSVPTLGEHSVILSTKELDFTLATMKGAPAGSAGKRAE